jgi:hypothetical protein
MSVRAGIGNDLRVGLEVRFQSAVEADGEPFME